MDQAKTELSPAHRNFGIDLLRLMLMYMVCMLHVLNAGGILDASEGMAVKHGVFWFIEVLSFPAVDSFAIISGYMASNRHRRYNKLLEMWFQAFFYSFVLTAVFTVTSINQEWDMIEMAKSAFPVTFSKFWYFTAFVVVFFVGPYISQAVQAMSERRAKAALFILVILFVRVAEDPFVTKNGYSAMWLLVMYCLGALAKKVKLLEEAKAYVLVLLFGLCVWFSWQFYVIRGSKRFISYISPTIVLAALILVVLFSRLRLNGRILAKVSPLAFGIYLFQLNDVIWNKMTDAFAFLVEKNIIVGVILALGVALGIFIAGLAVEKLRCILAKWLKIDALCRKIVDFTARKLSRI